MTDSPSDATQSDPFGEYAADLIAKVKGLRYTAEHGTLHIYVDPDNWVTAATTARDDAGLDFFSWLSAVDWAKDVAVGEPADDADNLEERFDVLCRLSSSTSTDAVILATSLSKDDASLDSLTSVYAGAAWHERETSEMFGIDFPGHPNLVKLYLPQEFEGHPLRKSFALGTRHVKPWPGHVDVEDLASTQSVEVSTENVEAAAQKESS